MSVCPGKPAKRDLRHLISIASKLWTPSSNCCACSILSNWSFLFNIISRYARVRSLGKRKPQKSDWILQHSTASRPHCYNIATQHMSRDPTTMSQELPTRSWIPMVVARFSWASWITEKHQCYQSDCVDWR